MGVHESSANRTNVTKKMARDRSGSDYSENMSDATTCSCVTSSVDKCSLRSCTMFQEPFFLHPPGSRPRDGIYINPMSAFINEPQKPKDTESFYLHSPHDLVYTRITHLFNDTEKTRNGVAERHVERKDETLTVKVDVHINNGAFSKAHTANGQTIKAEMVRDTTEHAYEQICLRQDDTGSIGSSSRKKVADNASDTGDKLKTRIDETEDSLTIKSILISYEDTEYAVLSGIITNVTITRVTSGHHSMKLVVYRVDKVRSKIQQFEVLPRVQLHKVPTVSSRRESIRRPRIAEVHRSRKAGRRYSRSSSASECSNMSSEIHCFSSTTSTPSLSRNSSNERINKSPKMNSEVTHERKDSTVAKMESEKEIRPTSDGPCVVKPPPPPPPPPPDMDDHPPLIIKHQQANNDKHEGNESNADGKTANKSDASCGEHQQPEVPPASPPADAEEIKTSQPAHLVNRHMVLPFIPPKFANATDSNTLLKPSEYLKSICKNTSKNSLSKARSVDNLDIQGRSTAEEPQKTIEETESRPGPPPPPLSPLQKRSAEPIPIPPVESEIQRTPQPLATISIQDLTSIQLRRTNTKMNATKTFSAPPPRSVSMTNVSEPFFVQKTDLIAELKRTKDIPGIKKLKVERAQVEKTQEQNLMSEITKAFSVSKFVDQIPEKDSSGNVIPIWKRQMLARKAAERAKKELEEQIAKENEEKRQKAIPPWKRQLLAKKDSEEKRHSSYIPSHSSASTTPLVKVEVTPSSKRDTAPIICMDQKEEQNETEEKRNGIIKEDSDDGQIIPWRAQLRKTNSKLNILD